MKLQIGDTTYDIDDSLNDASLTFVKRLTKACGFGPKTLAQRLNAMAAMDDPTDMVEDPDLMDTFCALLWIVRTHAGETLSLDEAADVPLSQVRFVIDDDAPPVEGEPDPTKALTASGQGDEQPAPAGPEATTGG